MRDLELASISNFHICANTEEQHIRNHAGNAA